MAAYIFYSLFYPIPARLSTNGAGIIDYPTQDLPRVPCGVIPGRKEGGVSLPQYLKTGYVYFVNKYWQSIYMLFIEIFMKWCHYLKGQMESSKSQWPKYDFKQKAYNDFRSSGGRNSKKQVINLL